MTPRPSHAIDLRSASPLPVLSPAGPEVVVGGADPFRPDIRPDARSLFGPRSVHLDGEDGPLFVADTGHHRVLVFAQRPTSDGPEAQLVLGQPDFFTEGRNAGRDEATPETLNVPTGLTRLGAGLAVADSWNNRVLIWHRVPQCISEPADVVLGQGDFAGQRPNRDRTEPGPDTLHWPFQVLVHEQRLYVADAGNRRVLVWKGLPTVSGQPADFALGQPDLTSRSDNGGEAAGAGSLRWPHDLTVIEGNLVVADAGNNRILIWDGLPETFNSPATMVLGQKDFSGTEHNQAVYWPTAETLNMPYAINVSKSGLLVADTANSRILGFEGQVLGPSALRLTGQPDFRSKGDNRNKLPVRDSLCWPYGLHVVGNTAAIADTGNHRVLLWSLADAY